MQCTLNVAAAKASDVIFAKIEAKGRYFGTLTRAEAITSAKGTKGIDLSFKDASGATSGLSGHLELPPRSKSCFAPGLILRVD